MEIQSHKSFFLLKAKMETELPRESNGLHLEVGRAEALSLAKTRAYNYGQLLTIRIQPTTDNYANIWWIVR